MHTTQHIKLSLKKIAVPCTPEPKFDQGFLGWVCLPQFRQMSLLLLLTDKIISNKLLTTFCVQKMGFTCTYRMKFLGGVFI